MPDFAHILHLSHVNTSGADQQWFDASTGHDIGLSPRSVQYRPCLDARSIPALSESVLTGRGSAGRAIKDPKAPADITVTLRGSGESSDLSPLTGRVILGQSATIGGVGTGGDGTAYTTSAPFALASGEVVGAEYDVNAEGDYLWLKLTVRASAKVFQRRLPDKPLMGTRTGLLGDGATTATSKVVIGGYTAMPSSLTVLCRALVALVWDVGASDTQSLASTKAFDFYFKLASDGYSWQLCLAYSIDAGGTLEEVEGPTIAPDEALHWLSASFNTSTLAASFGVDGSYTSAAGSSSYVAPSTEAWQLMQYRSDTTTVAATLVGAWMLFSAVLTEAELLPLLHGRPRGDETNLVGWWPEAESTTLYDYAEANATAPLNGTISGTTTLTSLLEGTEELSGSRPPLIYQAQHHPMVPVDNARLIYRASATPVHLSRVLTNGVDVTVVPSYDVRSFLTASPGAGQVITTGWVGGLAKFNALGDEAEVAADIQGCSAWPLSLALGADHGNAYVAFDSSLDTAWDALSGWAFELNFSTSAVSQDHGSTVFSSHWLTILSEYRPTAGANLLTASVKGTTLSSIDMDLSSVAPNTTARVRVEAWNDGSDFKARLLLNGKVVVTTQTQAGESLIGGPAAEVPKLSSQNTLPASNFAHLGVLPMALWELSSPTTRSDADAEADQRLYLFSHPSFSATGLTGYWYRPTTDILQVDDETGNGYHGTVTDGDSSGNWQPGLCWSDPLAATVYTLRDRGGVAEADINITEAAYQGIEPAAQNLWIEGGDAQSGMTIAQAAHQAIGPGHVLIRPDGTVTIGLLVAATAGNSLGTITADRVEVGPKSMDFPPSRIDVQWGHILAAREAAAGADSERRALMAKAVRQESIPAGSNETIYGDDLYPAGRYVLARSRYRDRGPALRDGDRELVIWASQRPTYPVRVSGGYLAVAPGEIWQITDPRDGSTAYVMIVSRVSLPHLEEWVVQ